MLHLKIITPRKIVKEEDIDALVAPGAEGEITVLPRHTFLLSLLKEGIITIKKKGNEESLAIGGGYLETDGKSVSVLVSRAYGQSEIDQELTSKAIESAKKLLSEAKDEKQKIEAAAVLRKSIIDLKLIRRKGRRVVTQ